MARLATRFSQTGWIKNTSSGVLISIEGSQVEQQKFFFSLQTELPLFAEIQNLKITAQTLANFEKFEIVSSVADSQMAVEQLKAGKIIALKGIGGFVHWALADKIRDELKAKNVILEDSPDGSTRWRR